MDKYINGSDLVDKYINSFPHSTQEILHKIRQTIKSEAPNGTEAISYQIPVVKLNGKNLIYFAAWKNHVSIYPVPEGPSSYLKEIEKYRKGKGTLQFSFDKALPIEIIKSTTKFLKDRITKA